MSERGAETEVCKIASRKDVRRAGYEEIAEEDPALARSWRHGNRDEVSDGELLWAAIRLVRDPDDANNEIFDWVNARAVN